MNQVEFAAAEPRLLHVLNGDATRAKLERSAIPGRLSVWADALTDGPVPPIDVPAERWRTTRARFIAGAGWASFAEVAHTLAAWDAALDRMAEYDEVVIWCEHDLFDQLLLIRHLAWVGSRERGETRLSLICIGEYPGEPDFKGLGQLEPEQLALLLPVRTPVTPEQVALGRRAFDAFTSRDPRDLEGFLAERDATALRFLRPALNRLLAEYPSTRNGLARTEQDLLSVLASGRTSLKEVVRALHARDRVYYVTDVTLRALLDRLGGGGALRVVPAATGGEWDAGAEITPLGRALLDGREDWVRIAGIDRWIGGVHLNGDIPRWRWNPDTNRIVQS